MWTDHKPSPDSFHSTWHAQRVQSSVPITLKTRDGGLGHYLRWLVEALGARTHRVDFVTFSKNKLQLKLPTVRDEFSSKKAHITGNDLT